MVVSCDAIWPVPPRTPTLHAPYKWCTPYPPNSSFGGDLNTGGCGRGSRISVWAAWAWWISEPTSTSQHPRPPSSGRLVCPHTYMHLSVWPSCFVALHLKIISLVLTTMFICSSARAWHRVGNKRVYTPNLGITHWISRNGTSVAWIANISVLQKYNFYQNCTSPFRDMATLTCFFWEPWKTNDRF